MIEYQIGISVSSKNGMWIPAPTLQTPQQTLHWISIKIPRQGFEFSYSNPAFCSAISYDI